MKAIIIAAGRGSRLSPFTDTNPKCMVEVGGRPLLHHAVDHLRAAGIDEMLVVRGYAAEQVRCDGVLFVENPRWATTNVLASIFALPPEISGDLLIVYGDVIFRQDVVDSVIAAKGHIVPVVDIDWRKAYGNRNLHPVSEAEKVTFNQNGGISRIGKSTVTDAAANGEFIGMIRLDPVGSARLASAYSDAHAIHEGKPFGTAASFDQAYLTDLLQTMIDGGEEIFPAKISGGWREIDTSQDLDAARSWYAESI